MPEDETPPRFEEQAAQRELEHLQRAIEETRGRRRRANEAFDSFLKSFDERPPRAAQPAAAPPGPDFTNADAVLRASPPPPSPPSPPPAAATVPLPVPAQVPRGASEPPPVVAAPPTEAPEIRVIPAAFAPPAPDRGRHPYAVPGGIAVALAITIAFVAWRGRSGERTVEDQPSAPVQTAPALTPAPAPTSGSEQRPAAQLVTSRRVWMRVSVDGATTIEREVAENTTIPLQATSQIVVRAGDAGAVRVVIGGKDLGPLGPDGQVRTRAYPVEQTR
jgi:hypothetical protein